MITTIIQGRFNGFLMIVIAIFYLKMQAGSKEIVLTIIRMKEILQILATLLQIQTHQMH
jgi:hypothetical protein